MRKLQEECTEAELKHEKALYTTWLKEKAKAEEEEKLHKSKAMDGLKAVTKSEISTCILRWKKTDVNCSGTNHIEVVATMIASVWKVVVAVGDLVEPGSTLTILEAMKMEIDIRAPECSKQTRYKVEAILRGPGERVQAGDAVVLLSTIRD